ncbi:MAG: hypothetical protein BRC25_02540, partial [Parcubacteria group bacterium SW_6_46_9]
IFIASTSPGSDGFVKIANDLSRDVNLAGWHLRTAEGVSTLPDYTIVSARDSVTISNRGTDFSRVSQAQLLYPDGRVADSYRSDRRDKQDGSAESISSGEIDTDTTTVTVNEDSEQGSENENNSDSAEDKTQESSATNTNLQKLFTTSSQQAAASQANPGSYFWRWAGLLTLVVAAGVSVAVAVSRYAVTTDTEDKLAETFNINEM